MKHRNTIRNTQKQNIKNNGMTWTPIIALLSILVLGAAGIVGVVVRYHFDWSVLADVSFYENLADPSMRIVVVPEGLRREQVAMLVGSKLGWNEDQKSQFEVTPFKLTDSTSTTTNIFTEHAASISSQESFLKNGTNMEGYYFPKTYMLSVYDEPQAVQKVMLDTLQTQVGAIKKAKTTQIINEQTALTIASIIQREAAGKQDMNLISGIIWNRLFAGMKLQMDATVQYAKGNITEGWWPPVSSSDIKNIDSPYNTYEFSSLPPTPIASPGLAAIAAAYNPQKTSCMFYLHDKNRQIHCATTYTQHLKNIARYY